MGGFDAIPETKRDAVKAAVANCCGTVQDVAPLSGGASGALLFRVVAGGRAHLLRVEGIPSPLRNPYQYESMRIASDAGIAPRLLHVDEAQGIAITAFVREQPLDMYPGGKPALMHALGRLLRDLQAAPIFPAFVQYPDIVSRLFAYVRSTGLFASGVLDHHTEHLEELCTAHPWEPGKSVSAHNDPNARNVLFDGERLWLIDWESAYRNDPLVDVAIMLDDIASSQELSDILLQSWFGRLPNAETLQRLDFIRALTRLYYAGVLLSASALVPRAKPDADLAVPDCAAFRRMLNDGQVKPGAMETVHLVGKMYLASFLNGAPVPPLGWIGGAS